jgi:hypothetical protein
MLRRENLKSSINLEESRLLGRYAVKTSNLTT